MPAVLEEKELLKWTVKTSMDKSLPQNRGKIIILVFLISVASLLSIDYFTGHAYSGTITTIEIILGIVILFFIVKFITAAGKVNLEYSISDKGITKRRLYKNKILSAMHEFHINYSKNWGSLGTSLTFVPFSAISEYEINGNTIELINPGRKLLNFSIITNNNMEQVLSILKKYSPPK